MISSISQGSCIGPLLFLAYVLYVNDIDENLSFSHVLKYADDIKIYRSCNLVDVKFSRIELQSDLNSLDIIGQIIGSCISIYLSALHCSLVMYLWHIVTHYLVNVFLQNLLKNILV